MGGAGSTSDQAGADGATRIVEVGAKPETDRVATAECVVTMTPEAIGHLLAGTKKGDPIATAKIAGVIGVKQTPSLLPHCHP
ncbi:MAG: cyclic pyranopterin monophosphate synthase MoaC, partial [Actinomycetota bacterium]